MQYLRSVEIRKKRCIAETGNETKRKQRLRIIRPEQGKIVNEERNNDQREKVGRKYAYSIGRRKWKERIWTS